MKATSQKLENPDLTEDTNKESTVKPKYLDRFAKNNPRDFFRDIAADPGVADCFISLFKEMRNKNKSL